MSMMVNTDRRNAKQQARVAAEEASIPFVDLAMESADPRAIELVPEGMARRYGCLPFRIEPGRLIVVMSQPGDRAAQQVLSARSRMRVVPATGLREEILRAIDISYSPKVSEALIQSAASQYSGSPQQSRSAFRIELYQPDRLSAARDGIPLGEQAVVDLVNSILAQSIRLNSSDLHIEPQVNNLQIRFRVDGQLRHGLDLPMSVQTPVVSRLKVMAGMDIAEKRKPQDGQFSLDTEDKDVDVRAATIDTIYGEMMVLRFLDKSLKLYGLDDLGFQPAALKRYRTALESPYGMLLVSGPTGAGKTTTLYGSINEMDKADRNVITVEDPVEYRFPGVNSIQANEKAGIVFPILLRSILRLDPDVIMVGEIRDQETAQVAIQAALTGHLVLSTLHANEAVQVIHRLIDLGIEPFLLNAALVGIVCQRMVRRICDHCRESCAPTERELEVFDYKLGMTAGGIFRGTGCSLCGGSGYLGRTGIYEVLPMTESMRELITNRAGREPLLRQAVDEGMITMADDAVAKINAGITTPSEVMKRLHLENVHSAKVAGRLLTS